MDMNSEQLKEIYDSVCEKLLNNDKKYKYDEEMLEDVKTELTTKYNVSDKTINTLKQKMRETLSIVTQLEMLYKVDEATLDRFVNIIKIQTSKELKEVVLALCEKQKNLV